MEAISQTSAPGDCERLSRAVASLLDHGGEKPSLGVLASQAGWRPRHFQRKFQNWAGVSPGRFLEFLSAHHVRRLLDASATAPPAARPAPGQPHETFISLEVVAPGAPSQDGMSVDYGAHHSPFGKMLLAVAAGRICGLAFGSDERLREELDALKTAWPDARICHAPARTAPVAARLFHSPGRPRGDNRTDRFRLLARGTDFQAKVWRALLEIPPGRVVSYRRLAQLVGNPRGARAVAGAVAANPVAYLVPCHRVLRTGGALGGYRWGLARKRALLAWDAALAERGRTDAA